MSYTDDKKLLFEYMTKEQIESYKKRGYFWVIGPDHSVYQLRDGRTVWIFSCGRPQAARNVFAFDEVGRAEPSKEASLLTQLLFLTSDAFQLLLHVGCTDSTFDPELEGCPPMRGFWAVVP